MILTIPEFFAAFLSALELYFPEQVDPSQRTPSTPQSQVADEYDFIIVGGGSAGCVLANRLSENPEWTVLLIEAGGQDDYISDTPLLADFLVNSPMDWNYTTVKQEKACLSLDGACKMTRGKVIGGCSTINGAAYARGNREDYNEWERAGNIGWSYEDVLPYFIKAENMTEDSLASSPFHGTDGPMNVQYSVYKTGIRDELIKAGEEIGWKFGDYNGINQSVISYQQDNLNGPLRENTARGYLMPVLDRKNLNIILESMATKVIVEEGVAKGVEYFRDNEKYTVWAKKEVILSAGTVDTAKLLLLSGIGPKEELMKHDIDVVKDLPVGLYYQDHIVVIVYYELSEKSSTMTPSLWRTNESIMAYAKDKNGPLTLGPHGCEVFSFFNPYNSSAPPLIQTQYCSAGNIASEDEGDRHIIHFLLFHVEPKSVGNITLKSNDFNDPPLIQPNMFDVEEEVTDLEEGLDMIFKIMESETMSKYSPKLLTEEKQPACKGLVGREYSKCAIKHYSFPGLHCVGTARMGPDSEEVSVVSPEDLAVKGLERLRVVDASAMPTTPRGNIDGAVVMMAEKAADIINNRYRTNEDVCEVEEDMTTEMMKPSKPAKKPNLFEQFINIFKPNKG